MSWEEFFWQLAAYIMQVFEEILKLLQLQTFWNFLEILADAILFENDKSVSSKISIYS